MLFLGLGPAPAAAIEPDYWWKAPKDLEISPDGRSVYATSELSTLTFRRHANGGLAITDDRGPGGEDLVLCRTAGMPI